MPGKGTKKDFRRYLVSADEEYGLYVLDQESDQHVADMLLVYHFDSDRFTHIPEKAKALFVPPAELTSCKDEFGDEYKGSRLMARIREAIEAYEEELPGFISCQL